MVVAVLVLAVLAAVVASAVWPPPGTPMLWRRLTRPLRRRVRPRHYNDLSPP